MTLAILNVTNGAVVDASGTEYVIVAAGSELIATYVQQAIEAGQTAQEVLDAILAAGLSVGVFPSLATGLAGTTDGEYFWVGNAGTVTLYLNDSGSGVEIAELATMAALDELRVASAIGMTDGGNVQDAIAVAEDTQALLALTKSMAVGSYVGTADGFTYKVAPAGASDHHLTTAGGVKLYVIPQGPMLRQWGVLPDMGVDMWARIQTALDNSPDVLCEEGEYLITRGLRQTLHGSRFRGAGMDTTFIRAISPTGDDEFGGTDGNEAVVWAMGAEGVPVYGLKTEDMTLDCAGLMTGLPVGDVRLKGHHYRRGHGWEVNRVAVIECGSYAFWANDKLIEDGGTHTGSIGVYNDCVARDAEIFFETTGRCFVTYNRPRAEQTRTTWDWPVLGAYHFYSSDGLITVNDGYAKVNSSAIFDPLYIMKNVFVSGGYYEQENPGTGVIAMGGIASSNFDNWNFNDVMMVAAGPLGTVAFGGGSGADNKMTFKGGKQIALDGVGLVFTPISSGWGSVDMIGVDCYSTTTGAAVPRSLITAGLFKSFNVFGGNQKASGPAVSTSPVNAAGVKFTSVTMSPASSSGIAEIRQRFQGSGTFANAGGFAAINFGITSNVANKAKLVVTGAIEASAKNATGAGEGVAFTWRNPSANIIDILAPSVAVGRVFNYVVTEYV